MINARLNDRRRAPTWITLGAPLLGVPLLVGLLSVVAPPGQTDVDAELASSVDAPVLELHTVLVDEPASDGRSSTAGAIEEVSLEEVSFELCPPPCETGMDETDIHEG